MTTVIRMSAIAVLLVGGGVATAHGAPCAAGSPDAGDDCCFTNPRYTGVCRVTPAPDETCSDILAYLNNQASVGKTYCGNTKVRGGWAQIDCGDDGEAAGSAAPTSPDS